ncbi:MAG: UDP-N-acetylglucosamine 1-carboxyvinyltransferase [Oscillospiraceae bacterium]|jgi:UDP-N-acetylglucosamine 1-carboxyvinyltransferase|nr:UDP-N-acetylglucosamine 1-carboxyvinyltransferase [Oscillospiraceae bacterium]
MNNNALVIRGGRPLRGAVGIQGAKNSVLPILAATVMGGGEQVVRRCPQLSDVESTFHILRYLGCRVRREGDAVAVDPRPMDRCDVPDRLMREMRSSVVFLGAILTRSGEACMSFPGGCELGPRPIDLHLSALRALGAEIFETGGNLICRGHHMVGREVNLTFPSVGATENIMLAACGASGVTRITNAAREPEIEDLQHFLRAMGARVEGAGSSTVVIEGGYALHAAEHAILPDRIAAATYLAAGAAAGGTVTVEDVCPEHLSTVTSILAEAGCEVRAGHTHITLHRDTPLRAVRPVRTMPYPGFPTDAQSPLMAVAAHAEGTSVFVENIFENRFRHVGELARMGADIKVAGRVAVVCGVPRLYGAHVRATDLRGGAALLVAALSAEGESRLTGLRHLDRGYEAPEQRLAALGADIRRVEEPDAGAGGSVRRAAGGACD